MDKVRYKHSRAENRVWAIKKLGGECVNCGSTESLEFDHVDPKTKSFDIGRYLHNSRERLRSELKKCQLLCKDCHIEKTGLADHGTRSKYTAGCRCSECTEANTEYYREYHNRN